MEKFWGKYKATQWTENLSNASILAWVRCLFCAHQIPLVSIFLSALLSILYTAFSLGALKNIKQKQKSPGFWATFSMVLFLLVKVPMNSFTLPQSTHSPFPSLPSVGPRVVPLSQSPSGNTREKARGELTPSFPLSIYFPASASLAA